MSSKSKGLGSVVVWFCVDTKRRRFAGDHTLGGIHVPRALVRLT